MLFRSAVFTDLGVIGTLNASAFAVGTAFTDNLQRILYNPASGALSYDSNGSTDAGSVATFAILPLGLATQLSASFFRVV